MSPEISLTELKAVVAKYLLLADPSIIKFLAAICIANKIEGLTPTWVFLVGASSGGKSSLLEPFSAIKSSFFIDDLTGKTLFSGMKSHEKSNSLIDHIAKNAMVLITDFTLMLDKDEITAKQIMSQFRLIYDGKFNKFAGNSENQIKKDIHFGIIAGVTTAVYEKQQQYGALGERMVYYYFDQPDREAATALALDNIDKTDVMKAEMGSAFAQYVLATPVPDKVFPVDTEIKMNLIKLSEMATRARSSVSRNQYSPSKTVTQINALEMPARMAKQLLNIGQGLMALNREPVLTDEDKGILYKTAIDSIPLSRKQVMEKLTAFYKADIHGVAAALGLPYDTVKLHMEDLAALGVVTQHKGAGGTKFYFELKQEYRELISKFKHIDMGIGTLEKTEEAEPETAVPWTNLLQPDATGDIIQQEALSLNYNTMSEDTNVPAEETTPVAAPVETPVETPVPTPESAVEAPSAA